MKLKNEDSLLQVQYLQSWSHCDESNYDCSYSLEYEEMTALDLELVLCFANCGGNEPSLDSMIVIITSIGYWLNRFNK